MVIAPTDQAVGDLLVETGGYLTFENGTITDENVSVANVVGTAPAGNGWVYVVDRVLLPEADEK